MVRATGLATVTLGGGGAALVGCWLSPQLASRGASTSTTPARRAIAIGNSIHRCGREHIGDFAKTSHPGRANVIRTAARPSALTRQGMTPHRRKPAARPSFTPPLASHVAPSAISRIRRRARRRAELAAATTGPAARRRGAARCLFARRHRGGGPAGPGRGPRRRGGGRGGGARRG